jgi:phosphomannomutase
MPIHLPDDLMVSVSGVRGRVGASLTPELFAGVAASFGAFLAREGSDGAMVVARDSRTSGPMLSRAVVAGLQSVGCPVVELGVVPTPTLLHAVRARGARGGIGVTASHNPAEWNALKLVSHEGLFLDAELSARFRAYLAEEDPPRAAWDALGTVSRDAEAWDRHLDGILGLPAVEVDVLKNRGFTVAVDCVHGAGGPYVDELLRTLGCTVRGMGMEADGLFPRDPEPTAANLAGLGELVREAGADLGMAVDPDADRLSLVDETGTALGEDLTLALAAAAVLRRTPGTVVTNLSTSQVVEDVARAFDCDVVRAPVGEVNVARRMQEVGAVVGGEGNGGVILPALHHTRDAPLAIALVLQHLADEGTKMSEVAARWPGYEIVKQKMSFPRQSLPDAYALLQRDLDAPERDESDGLRLAWPDDGVWLHVRPSGTEPVVRLIAEARTAREARSLIRRTADLLTGVA